jgi:predicted ArsR family transcriptional regulator
MATGIERAADARTAVLDAARERGQVMAGAPAAASGLLPMLESQGYEPFDDDGIVRLRNCPFHVLVGDHRELTCALNHALLDGAAQAIEGSGYRAISEPREGLCCVAFVAEDEAR